MIHADPLVFVGNLFNSSQFLHPELSGTAGKAGLLLEPGPSSGGIPGSSRSFLAWGCFSGVFGGTGVAFAPKPSWVAFAPK